MSTYDPLAVLGSGITLLEASAGTGKTHSITGIVLRLVAVERIPLDQLLIVTFTDTATAELSDRVRRRLRDAREALEQAKGEVSGEKSRDELIRHIVDEACRTDTLDETLSAVSDALERYDNAAIRTIHSFCQSVLRDFAFESGAEVDAALLKDTAALLDEIARDFWALHVATLSMPGLRALEMQKWGGFDDLTRLIKNAADHPDAEVTPPSPDEPVRRKIGAEYAECECALRAVGTELAVLWRESRASIVSAFEAAIASKAMNGKKWRQDWVSSRAREADAWCADPYKAIPDQFRRFGDASSDGSVKAGGTLTCATVCEELLGLMIRHAELVVPLDVLAQHDLLALRHRAVRYARDEFDRRKRERRLLTFDDLLRNVRSALRAPGHGETLAAAVRKRYSVALIDEFQDTDDVQWEIFQRLFDSAEHRLVLIGDPKQSIYAFRGADVGTYLEARKRASRSEELNTNWRSDGPLVGAFNTLFSTHAMPMAHPGFQVPTVTSRFPAARLSGDGIAPFRIRSLRKEGAFAAGLTKRRLRRYFPRAVAADIARTLTSGAQCQANHGWRKVGPGDCAVLVRTNKQGREMQEALRELGIPSVLATDESVFDSREATELQSVLAAILEPAKTRLARSALATDLLGVAAARELHAEGGWRGVGEPGVGDFLTVMNNDQVWLERWLDRLREWHTLWERNGVMPMVRAILRDNDGAVPAALASSPDGERRLTNLLHLAELLHSASLNERLDPAALFEWMIRRRQEKQPDESDDRRIRLESDAEAVQLVTIHRSKGLEYSLVWVPWLWDGRLGKRKKGPAWVRGSGNAGVLALSGPDDEQHAQMQDAEYAENMRLLYVAITRARYRCTVWWGSMSDAESSSLGYLLLGGQAQGDSRQARLGTTQMLKDLINQGDDALRAALDTAPAGASPDFISNENEAATLGEVPRWNNGKELGCALGVRPWTRGKPLDERWREGSFTWMTRAAQHRTATEEPEFVADARPRNVVWEVEPSGEPALLADLERSARVGIAMHSIFQYADFSDLSTLPGVVSSHLASSGVDSKRWSDPVAHAVRVTLDAELRADRATLRLRDIGRGNQLHELDFTLPVCGGLATRENRVGPSAIAEIFRDNPGGSVPDYYADEIAKLPFVDFCGFLSGSIDLVLEHGGQWYLADYKSNHLGANRAHYGRIALLGEMQKAHYVLQYHLYLVALYRWLHIRVPGFDWKTQMGGVFYLFLRGMSSDPGADTGVYYDLPPQARIEALANAIYGSVQVSA